LEEFCSTLDCIDLETMDEEEYLEFLRERDLMIESGCLEDDEDGEDIRVDIIECFLEEDYRVVFCFYDYQLNWRDKDEQEFIEERTMAINREWPYIIPKPTLGVPKIRWYEVHDIFELKKELEYYRIEFTCAIVHKDGDVKDAKYILNATEGRDFDFLHIIDKSEVDFLERVVPKLKILLKDKLKITNER
jgi:hypothetical protein